MENIRNSKNFRFWKGVGRFFGIRFELGRFDCVKQKPHRRIAWSLAKQFVCNGPTCRLTLPRACKPRRIGSFCGLPFSSPSPSPLSRLPTLHPPAAPRAPRPAPPPAPARCHASVDLVRRRSATRTHSSSSTSPSVSSPLPRFRSRLQLPYGLWIGASSVFGCLAGTTADDLFPLFDKYGEIVDIYIPRDRRWVRGEQGLRMFLSTIRELIRVRWLSVWCGIWN